MNTRGAETAMADQPSNETPALDEDLKDLAARAISQPLVTHIYTADPSAHVFEGKLYVYCSHDIEGGVAFNDDGAHFCMEDYHVLSMDSPDGPATDCGLALHVSEVPWAERQMWAPDAACRDGRYYLYFPAKTAEGLFRIGVAVGEHPAGPFTPQPRPIDGTYSIDPSVFADDDGEHYLLFGGIWGGQLQKYRDNAYDAGNEEPRDGEPALGPRIARLRADMLELDEPTREVQILDKQGRAYATGRRKDAVARVWLKPGTGKITVNGRDQEVYFARPTLRLVINQPFGLTDRVGSYDIVATVKGGGLSGQAGAVLHGIAQALTRFEPALRGVVKTAGFLTRDSRAVERKKYGKAKARRSFQFSKR